MGMLDVSKKLNVSLSRVAAVAKQKPAPVTRLLIQRHHPH